RFERLEPVTYLDTLERRRCNRLELERHVLCARAHDVAHHRGARFAARAWPEIRVIGIELGVGIEVNTRIEDHAAAGRRVMMAFSQCLEQRLARESGREQARQPAICAEQ